MKRCGKCPDCREMIDSGAEYCKRVIGNIVETDDSCAAQATIPIYEVESVSDVRKIANGFVHVAENDTTYYVDDKHRILTTWSNRECFVEKDVPADIMERWFSGATTDAQAMKEVIELIKSNPWGLKSQTLILKRNTQEDEEADIQERAILSVYYDSDGIPYADIKNDSASWNNWTPEPRILV